LPPFAASAAAEGEVVGILVPRDAAISTVAKTGYSPSGWVRIEVPLEGSLESTRMSVEEATGTQAIIERVYPLAGPTDEPFYDEQWSLENTGQNGTVDADIDATTAWGISTGSGVVVAVIDSGIDPTHVELDGQIWTNPGETVNGIDDDGNGLIDDISGWDMVDFDNNPGPVGSGSDEAHATMVTGIIAAEVNGTGISGVAYGAKVMNLRACSGGTCASLDVANAIYYAVDEGADIINLSLGGAEENDPLFENAIDYAEALGVLVIAASGNASADIDDLSGSLVFIPAGLPNANILSVAASDRHDDLALFSNWGAKSVDVAAPGESILTTGAAGLSQYVYGSGTSFAAPVVAGIAALLMAHDPGAGPEEVIARIEGFVDSPSGVTPYVKTGRVNAGRTLTKRFIDIGNSVFEDAIDWLAGEQITQGCNPPANHKFCPNDFVSRGQMAVFLSRAFELPGTTTDYFSDDTGEFYEQAANRIAEAGLTVGCAPGLYCGDLLIPRGQMAAMLSRALDLPQSSTDHFSDDNTSVFEGAINRIADVAITQGCNPPSNTNFCPKDSVTRGQMAAFIKRAIEVSEG
jgi:subtilisin family serine protease